MMVTPVPSRILSVCGNTWAMNTSLAGIGSHVAVWCWPIQASEKPSSSAHNTHSMSSSKVWVRSFCGGCKGIMNLPTFILHSPGEFRKRKASFCSSPAPCWRAGRVPATHGVSSRRERKRLDGGTGSAAAPPQKAPTSSRIAPSLRVTRGEPQAGG